MGARAGKGAQTAAAAAEEEEEEEEVLVGVRKGKQRQCTSAST
jgi:hypothetical protein